MLLVKPFLGCNLACKYCYEGNYRRKHNPKMDYNLDLVLKRMEEFKDLEMSLHGGECLAMPKKDVEKFLAKMFELTKKSGIQTNGTLIDEEYIEMFKKYKTDVGISFDGPGVLSEYRGPLTFNLDKTIERLVREGISTSIIMVISKSNAGTDERLKKLKEYLLELDKLKISGRINPCVDAPAYELGEKRLIEVYLDLAEFCFKNNLRWSPFTDIIHGLQGKPRVCIFMGCDFFSTASATVIVGDGSITNCMRTNKENILLRHPVKYNTREEILAETPQEFFGCQGCKYFTACYGGCPTSAINNDWRNRTYLCSLWKALFQYYENILRFVEYPSILLPVQETCFSQDSEHLDHEDSSPVTEHGDAHGDIPHGDSSSPVPVTEHGDVHGDIPHGDSSSPVPVTEHGDVHGDIPHGDSHGDLPHSDQ